MTNENTQEQVQTVAPEIQNANPESGLLGQVGALLRGDPPADPGDQGDQREQQQSSSAAPGDNDEPEGEQLSDEGLGLQSQAAAGGDSTEGAASGLHSLAEKAGVSIEDLYKLEVALGDEREPVTLGDMKDRYQQIEGLDDARITLADERTTFENDILKSRAELQEVVAMLPQIPPEMLQKAQAQVAANIDSERQALYRVKPEWKDPATFSRVKDQIFDVVGDYGFTRGELDSVFDHRLTKLLHDFTTMRERFSEASASRKRQVDAHKQGRRKGSQKIAAKQSKQTQLNRAAAAPSHSQDKLNAVKQLLNTGAI